jgi:recombination protein RecT
MNEINRPVPGSTVAISKFSTKPLKECATLEEAFQTSEFMERIESSVPQHVQPNRMLRTFITAANRSPLLYQASVRSFVGACLTLSQVGLEPNTPLQHAHLIPFKNKRWNPKTRREEESVEINVIFGYPGLLDLSYRTRLVRAVHADVVWPGDEFSFEYGSNAHVRHVPRGTPRQGAIQPVWAYMHAVLADGQAFEVMPYADVLAIRDKAQGYRYALAARQNAESQGKRIPATWTEAPWVAHEIAMARKTAFRAGSKWLPRSVELASVIALDEAQDRRRSMDFGPVMEAPTIDGKADYLGAAVDAANTEEEERTVDPGTAHGIRTQPDNPPEPSVTKPAEPPKPIMETVREALDKGLSNTETPPPPPPTTADPEFGAVLVDATGEPSDEFFIDPVAFARAYAALWQALGADAREAIAEHNADAITDAVLMSPEAEQILQRLEASPAAPEPAPSQTIEPAQDRGKVLWADYVKSLRSAARAQSAASFAAWADAQREVIGRSPPSQRALAVRALKEASDALNIRPLPWLAELLRPKERTTEGPTQQAAGEALDDDEQWVADRTREVRGIDNRPAFDALVRSKPVREMMARLRRDRPALFARADAAFSAKHAELPPAEDMQ